MKIVFTVLLLIIALFQQACTSDSQAPVVDGWKQNSKAGNEYRVQPGDSVYSIAWAFGMDYHDLVRYNQLSEPYHLQPGQTLHMYQPAVVTAQPAEQATTPVAAVAVATPVTTTAVTPAASTTATAASESTANTAAIAASPTPTVNQTGATPSTAKPSIEEQEAAVTRTPSAVIAKPTPTPQEATVAGKWLWPTQGKVVRDYSAASGGNHGLDITGKLNQPILASAAGKVVYAGSGMPGYGNLIIIKHNENDLSAYAFNKTINVKEGEAVKAGQCIAYMGKNNAGQTLLHFEIRRDGKPVDPKHYLK